MFIAYVSSMLGLFVCDLHVFSSILSFGFVLFMLKYHNFYSQFTYCVFGSMLILLSPHLRERHCQATSLAGAVYLLNDKAGVLRRAQRKQKFHVDQWEKLV